MRSSPIIARRQFLQDGGLGLGQIALTALLGNIAVADQPGSDSSGYRFPATAKRVIFLCMAGAPSQLELFDYKPKLRELEGQPIPPSIIKGQRYAFIQPDAAVLGPRFQFRQVGETGTRISEVLPHFARVVDDVALIRSMHTDKFNHAPAQLFLNTGSGIPGRPAMGAWLSYGLGNEADDLPAFVVLKSGGGLSGGAGMWGAGFLPSEHQGVPFRPSAAPILHTENPRGLDQRAQRESIDLIRELNQDRFELFRDPEITARIAAYEMAFRMQTRAPELMDFSQETTETLEAYGVTEGKPSFATNCLIARRLAERGVRFIQVYHAGWDHHSDVEGGVRGQCKQTDQASAALLEDLRQRGLLDDTLVVWGGEFGRTPMVEASAALGRSKGRDHHPQAFTVWLSGGGIRAGARLGRTDELGFHVVEDAVHIHDLQATVLHCLGIDHRKFVFNYRGLDFRLTGVEAHAPVTAIMA